MGWRRKKGEATETTTGNNAQKNTNGVSAENKTITEEVRNLNKNILMIVQKAHDEIKKEGAINGDIKNLLNFDLFDVSNWDLSSPLSISKMLESELGSSAYIATISHPLSEQFKADRNSVSTYEEIYDDIVDSFIQERNSIYKDVVLQGLISQYNQNTERNNEILAFNLERLVFFYDHIEEIVKNRIGNIAHASGGVVTNLSIDEIILELRESLAEKRKERKRQAGELEERITLCRDTITGEKVTGDPEPLLLEDISAVLIMSGKMALQLILAPFRYLGRGLGKFSSQFQKFSTFVGVVSDRSAFWIAILFAIFNGVFLYQIFHYMFSGISLPIVILFTSIYLVAFTILPFTISKHVLELIEGSKSIDVIIMLTIEVLIILAAAITYPLMAVRYWRTDIMLSANHENYYEYYCDCYYDAYCAYCEVEQTSVSLVEMRSIAAIVIGVIPFFMAICIGFMNYRQLKRGNP